MKYLLLILVGALPCLGQAQSCVPAPAGLVSWWRGENNGNDSAGTNNGILVNTVDFEPGLVGQCFHFVSGGNPRVYVPDNPTLELTNSLTIEAWVKANFGYNIMGRGDDRPELDPYVLGFTGLNSLIPNFVIYALSGQAAEVVAPGPIPANVWVHLAATLDDASGNMCIYVNGQLVAQTNTTLRPAGPLTGPNPSLCIGNAPGTSGFPFDGWIDEAALYSRALSQSELQAIYAAGAAGKCIPGPPAIVMQPRGQVGYWGGSVTFAVAASGDVPLDYLWYKDGLPITWATNSTLVLTNLALDAGGSYSVQVTNVYGSATSSNALLTVNPSGVSLGLYPGLTVQGTPGNTYGIQYATNLTTTPTWITITQFTLMQPVELWFDSANDTTSGHSPNRFYRVVPVP